ncbi:MAG: sugar transferase [Candidatus Omnitrophica bacterium]|nr:sugar transferase [Candidatus Omnitrophota bacterium]
MVNTLAKRYLIRLCYIIIDIIIIALAFYCTCFILPGKLKFDLSFYHLFFWSDNPFRSVFHLWMLVILILNYSIGLYETKRELSEVLEVWQVLKANLLAALIVIVSIYVVKIEGFPRSIFSTSCIFLFGYLSIWRVLKRGFVDYIVSHGYNNFNVLIIGAGKVGSSLVDEIRSRPSMGLIIVGFLDDFKPVGQEINKVPVIGKIPDFFHIARKEFITRVYITIHLEESKLSEVLEQAKEFGIDVHVVPHGYQLIGGRFSNSNIGIIPVLQYSGMHMIRQQFGKRVFDFILAICIFIVLSPLFLMIAIMIKLDSPGPVFHLSKRFGRKGYKFRMLKFRSMVQDAEKKLNDLRSRNEVDGPIFKIKEDPRITPFGKILRKYSLDELPQLINVIKGDMSLVGPRPLLTGEVERDDLRQLQRLEVRPGMTGLWQVRGRSDVSFSRLLRWDVWYINNWSFWLDLNILFETLPVVIRGKGAY